MIELKLFLFAQGLRFLLFDYRLFAPLRSAVSDIPLLSTLLRCPFCQGFWCCFFAFLPSFGIMDAFMWGLGSGVIALTWYVFVIPRLDELEDGHQ